MLVAQQLDTQIAAVCPILGVSIGNENDKSTWRIDFATEATAEQRAAAAQVIQDFAPETPAPEPTVKDLIRALKEKEVLTDEDIAAAKTAEAEESVRLGK